MAFTQVADGDLAVSTQLQQVIDALSGISGAGQPISLTTLDDDGEFALSVKNLGTGGLGLKVLSSAGADLLEVRDSYTVIDNGTVKVDHTNNRVGINNTNPAVALDVTGSASISGSLVATSTTLSSASVSGALSAGSASISGALSAGSASISGALSAGSASVSGALSAGSASISGALSAGATTLSGALSAPSATISGTVSASTLSALSGSAIAGNLPIEGGTTFDRLGISQGSATPSPSSHSPLISIQRVASHNAPVYAQSSDYYYHSTRYGRASVARTPASGGSSTTVVKSGAGWTPNAFVGHQVDLLMSPIQRGIITSNTSDTLTISGTFSPAPTAGTEFVVNAGGSIDLYTHAVYVYDDNQAMPADVRPSTIAVSGFSKQAANSTATTFGALFLGEMGSTNGNSIGVEIDIVNNAGTAATYPTVTGNLQTIGLNIASFCSDAGYAGTYNSLGILLQSSGPNSAMRTGILFGANSALTYGIDFKPLTAGSTTPKPIRLGSGHQIVGRNAEDNADVSFLAWEIDDTLRLRSTNGTMFESNAGTEWARINSGGVQLLKGSGGAPSSSSYLNFYPKSDNNFYKQTSAADEVRILDADIFTAAGSLVHGTGAETFSELSLGTKGHALLADTSAPKYEPLARRNRVINGCMRVQQRTTLGSTDDSYTLDRWTLLLEAANAATVTQETSDIPSDGSKYAMKMAVGSANNNKFGIATYLEYVDIGDLRGKTISLQAKLKATSGISDVRMAVLEWTGTGDTVTSDVVSTSGNQWHSAGNNPDLASSWTYLATPANLNVTTSWATYKIENLTVGASANNLAVFIWCNDKTTTTTTDILRITDVQLEEGSICTQFERRPLAVERLACRRYCRTYGIHTVGVFPSATHWAHTVPFTDTPMRTSPTGTLLSTTIAVTEPTVAVRTGTSCTLVPFLSSTQGYSARITAADFAGTPAAFAFGNTQDMVLLDAEL